MPVLELTNEQAVALLRQLPPRVQRDVLMDMANETDSERAERMAKGGAAMRRLCAERGLDFDSMSDEERIDLVNELVHEDRV